jgi:hypothetical protein
MAPAHAPRPSPLPRLPAGETDGAYAPDVLLTSLFTPAPGQPGALVASIWQGEAPPGLVVQRWLYLGEPLEKMLLIWEAADEQERDWLLARIAPFGDLETWVTSDATAGMATAIARDLDGFGQFLRSRGSNEEAIATELDVRRRGAASASLDDAVVAAAEWAAEHKRR